MIKNGLGTKPRAYWEYMFKKKERKTDEIIG